MLFRSCFCHVGDVVRAVVALLDRPDAVGQVFNVGSMEEISIMRLAERIIDRAASSSKVDLIPYHQAYAEGFEDMRRRVPDIGKIRAFLGWEPTFTLDDILDQAISEARAELSVVGGRPRLE